MNRFFLLLLSVWAINLFGTVLAPEILHPENTGKLSAHNGSNLPSRQSVPGTLLMDTIPPVLNCPASDTILLTTQGSCDTVLNYTVTATDDQGPAIVIQLSGLVSGSTFDIGASTCVYLATDLAGNTATCAFTFTVQENATPTLVCDDLFIVELDTNCVQTIVAQQVLEGGPYGCWDQYLAEVDKVIPFGNGPWIAASFNAIDIDQSYQYRITDTRTGNKCWGNVKVEDNTPPVFICQDLVVSCSEDELSPNYLKETLGIAAAMPQVSDACGPIDFPTYVDITSATFNCDSPYTEIISRRWQAMDESDNISTCIQRIKLRRHTIAELQLPPDVTLNCPDTSIAPAITGWPFLMDHGKRYELENNSICDLSAFYEDFLFTLPCGDQRIGRMWEYFDFCTGVTEGPFLQNIYILDESNPTVTCPPSFFVSLNADTCHGLVDLPDAILDDACSQLATFQAFWMEDGLGKTQMGTLADFSGNDPADFDTLGVMGSVVLPVGTTTITYVTEDSCGNIGDCTFNLTVADRMPPAAQCDTFLTLQLQEDGLLAVAANVLDNGSTDDCTPLTFKARFIENTPCLYDTIWTDSLRFCCLNLNDTLDAVLRVYDIPVPFGTVVDTFGAGHFSDCELRLAITDPNPPLCTAPQNLTVNCEDFDPTLELYGNITSTSCAVDSVALELDYTQFDTTCHRGVINRIFKVYDTAGNVGGCAQAITVDYLQDYFTKFPNDVIATMCDGTGLFGEPILFGQGCEDFDVDFTDELFTVVPDACFKIERTWKITNKCTYDPDLPLINVPNPNPNAVTNHSSNLPGPTVSACGTPAPWSPTVVRINPSDPSPTNYCTFFDQNANGYQYKQIIKVIDGQAPTGTYIAPTCSNQNWTTVNNPQFWNETYWNDPILGGHDLCEEPADLSFTATDACGGSNINLEFLLFLDLDGDNIMETVINSLSLGANGLGWNNVLYNNRNTPNFGGGTPQAFDGRAVPAEQKMGFAIEETVSGNNKTARVRWNTQEQPNVFFNPELPHGTHQIKWFATDNCGNNIEYNHTFTLKDCKTPTVVCQSTLSVNLPPAGLVVLHPSDFLDYTEDNCTPENQIQLGVRKCGTGTGFPTDGNGDPVSALTFDCFELGTQCVELWAIDKAGNADKCELYLSVQDNAGNCPGTGNNNFGWIKTAQGAGIENALVEIVDNSLFSPPIAPTYPTNSQGYFSFPTSPIVTDFSVVPEKTDNPLNGVTTFDLVLISKHILGIETLNSPYKMIAADGNKSGSITTFDIVEFRKLILGIYTAMPNNTSWRFVDSSFVFPNPLNPFQAPFPEMIPLMVGSPFNFVGIKVGDVNFTAVPNVQAPAQERFEGSLYFDTEDRMVQPGEVFELKFNASELLEGCQFSLETDGLEILEVLPGANMSKEHFALFPPFSLLTLAWETGGQANFSLKLKAQKAGSLREMLRISDQITRAEAYKTGAQPATKQRVALRFSNPAAAFELFQNQPNPFESQTAITFQLPEASRAALSIFDAAGKLLWTKTNDYPAGLNTVDLDLSGLSTAGVLYYQLETPAHSAVRKMVRI